MGHSHLGKPKLNEIIK